MLNDYSCFIQITKPFALPPKMFGCFVYDNWPDRTKLNQMYLFRMLLNFQKGQSCYCPRLIKFVISVDIMFMQPILKE